MTIQSLKATIAAAILLFVCVGAVSGTTIVALGGSIPAPGDTKEFPIVVDSLPNGLSGFTLTFTVSDAGKAEITGIIAPQWAYNPDNPSDAPFMFISTLPSDAVEVTIVDLYGNNNRVLSNITLVTLQIRGISQGSTGIQIADVAALDDFGGNPVDASIQNGTITIGSTLPPANGTINASSTPTGADVLLDGLEKGITPLTISDVEAGTHALRLEKSGYYPYQEDVMVTAGQTTSVTWILNAVPADGANGTINVSSIPTGADVLFDGMGKGITPLTIFDVEAGTHALRLEKSGYYPYQEDVMVTAGQTTSVTWTLSELTVEPVNGTLDIDSTPSGADVYLDGEIVGVTPVVLTDISPGEYTILIQKDGYEPFENPTVMVSAGNTTQVAAILQEISSSGTVGSLDISSIPSDADVYLDDAFEGHTPLRIVNLEEGSYMLRIDKAGYDSWIQAITIVSGKIIFITAPLTPTPTTIPTPSPTPTESSIGTGGLYVVSEPTATVFVDGIEFGKSNEAIQKIPSGIRNVTLFKPGFNPNSVMVDIGINRVTVTAKIVLQPVTGPTTPGTVPATKPVTTPTTVPTTVPTALPINPGSNPLVPTTGGVFVYTVPFGCSVYIDGIYRGSSPNLFTSIEPGSHIVNLTLTGYEDNVRPITVKAGDITMITVMMIPDFGALVSAIS
jgi:hypothetical protein